MVVEADCAPDGVGHPSGEVDSVALVPRPLALGLAAAVRDLAALAVAPDDVLGSPLLLDALPLAELLPVEVGQPVVVPDVVGVCDEVGDVEPDRLVAGVDGALEGAGCVRVGVPDVRVGDGCGRLDDAGCDDGCDDDGWPDDGWADGGEDVAVGWLLCVPVGVCGGCGAVGLGLADGGGASGGGGSGPGSRPA